MDFPRCAGRQTGPRTAVADQVGLNRDALKREVVSDEVKDRLTKATDTALAAGAVGVPTVLAAGQSFWGDDQLEAAAVAIAGSQP